MVSRVQHVIFGRVVEGLNVVLEMEQVATDERDRPTVEVLIVDCGELALGSKHSTVSTRAG